MSRSFPHRAGESLTLRCESMASDGLGRATVAGKEVRLRFAVVGEEAIAEVTHVGQHAVWATVTAPVEASKDRVRPRCPVVTECGGCPWQHLSVRAQRALRMETLKEALADIAGIDDATWHDWVPARRASAGYRTRALMMLRHVSGKMRAGFYAPRSQDLVPAETCLVQSPRLQMLIPKIVSILDTHQLPTWRGPHKPGLLRGFSVRAEGGKTPALVTLVATKIDPRLVTAANHLVKLHGVGGVYGNVNDRDGGPVMGPETFHLAGERLQPYVIGGLTLNIGPTAFVQTNHDAAVELVDHVMGLVGRAAGGGAHAHLADMYGGVGVFGLNVAARGLAERVTIVENAASAVEDARRNAVSYRRPEMPEAAIDVVEADAADGARLLADLGAQGPDVVIVDPPRAGMDAAVIDRLLAMPQLRTLIYVSCNPRTLARDLGRLTAARSDAGGPLVVTDVAAIDMFPNTPHSEAVARLTRQPATA